MKKVLIVEDDKALSTLYKSELEMKGYTVSEIADGALAVQAVRDQRPDLVLLDVMLPGKNGLEILHEIKSDEDMRDTRIIVLTNFGNEENVSTALEYGALDYIMKYKIVPAELGDKVVSVMGDAAESVVSVTNQ